MQQISNANKIKLIFMVNLNLINGGGMERALLYFIKYMPEEYRDIFDIKVIQTDIYDKIRIVDADISDILEQNSVEMIKLENYNKNLFNSKIGLLDSLLNALTEKRRNKNYSKLIEDVTSKADIIYLFHNSFSSQISKGPIVIGSFHERNPNPKAYSWFSRVFIRFAIILIKSGVLFKRIDYYHYQALNLERYVPKKSFYIPLGLDLNKFMLDKKNESVDNIIRILFVGRLIKSKGIKIIIDVFNIIKDKGRYELHIVGSGEMEYYIKNLKINGLVYHGQLNDESLIRLYKYCDVFVFPSQSDIYGLVILEAIASMEYAIVSESLKGVFDDFERLNVLEYSKHNSHDIANRLMRFKKNTNRYNEKVYLMIKQKYDWQVIDKKLYNKFQELLNKSITNE